jgi:hypothetical protein
MPTLPTPLTENTGLAFVGEIEWSPAFLTVREAKKLLTAVNACGRPNSDVLRRRLTVVDGEPSEGWQIDFPDHFTAQEAALYERPFALLGQRSPDGWRNPHAHPALRRALARVSRYLAMPARARAPDWRWLDEALLPDASLLVVTRDDDYTHGILLSQPFSEWFEAFHRRLEPGQVVESFPFPWAPATPLNALSAAQEELRHAIARAARSGNLEQLNSAVVAAYGWQADSSDDELLGKLTALNRARTAYL